MINYLTYTTLPDAIRFVDPEWNYVEKGQRLWPAIFYILGFAERPPEVIVVYVDEVPSS